MLKYLDEKFNSLSLSEQVYIDYFKNPHEPIKMEDKKIHLLDFINVHAFAHTDFASFYALLGCKPHHMTISMNPFRPYKLDLTNIIGNGELLFIRYEGQLDGGIPIEMHPNTPVRHKLENVLFLYPVVYDSSPKSTTADVFFWYAPETIKSSVASELLIDAFKRFYEENFRIMIISLQSSLELMQYEFNMAAFRKYNLIDQKYQRFLSFGAFKSLFNALSPFIAASLSIPLFPNIHHENIKTLIKCRNEIIHSQKEKPKINTDSAKSMLISAFLLYKYYQTFSKSDQSI